MKDDALFAAIEREYSRQQNNIELIASENYVSKEVLAATGSILTNKYAEGYPRARYYGGCEYVDEVEDIARQHLKELFKAEHVNVQPHSGSQANMAVYMSILEPGDEIMGMSLKAGGHLTHGYSLNFSGKLYESHTYGVNKETEMIDYDEVAAKAQMIRPKMIVAGASAYPRIIDFEKFRQIADSVGAYLMVDMAHIAGLVAAGVHPSPVPYADFITSTTHKTLRGPRGGIVLCKEKYAKALDKTLFPGMQGGPLMHVIAGKAQCFYEALDPSFKEYMMQVVKNAKAMADRFMENGLRVVTGGTDNHLLLLDLTNYQISGKEAEALLDEVNITCNKNTIPNDPLKANITSGIRVGTAAMTTRGFKENEFIQTADLVSAILRHPDDEEIRIKVKEAVRELTCRFPYQPY